MITVANLIACGVGPTQAKIFAPHLEEARARFEIRTLPCAAAFVAEGMFESTNFTRMEEGLFYSSPERIHAVFKRLRNVSPGVLGANYVKKPQALANLAYANINGNGDESSGDGWKYRGRGIFQLTGRANYMAAGNALGMPYKESPELVAQPRDAAMTAAWFWAAARLNQVMERAGIDAVSKRINGGDHGLVQRRDLYAACVRALG